MARKENAELQGDEFSKGYFWVCRDNIGRLVTGTFWVKRSKQTRQMTKLNSHLEVFTSFKRLATETARISIIYKEMELGLYGVHTNIFGQLAVLFKPR